MFKYFVAYKIQNQTDETVKLGAGNSEIHYHKEIEGYDDIEKIQRFIEEEHNLDKDTVIIINFIKLN